MYQKISEKLINFINQSPTCYHAVENMKNELQKEGFEELLEGRQWKIKEHGKYFVTRNGSAIIAFKVPGKGFTGFQIAASHSDSPSFKVKENAEIEVDENYVKLNVEKYGGMICSPWFDRPLSVAGKIVVRDGDTFTSKLVNVDRDLLMIPNMAIHMNREINDGYKYNIQIDMLPVFGDENSKGKFMSLIAETAGVKEENILGTDLFLYNRMKGIFWGADNEYISSSRLDDLQCAFSSMEALINGNSERSVSVMAVMDNEEVGSGTKQGALSTFLYDVLTRINDSLGRTKEQYLTAIASSFMISADNAHAVHPNHTDKADPTNRPYMNKGIVIKYNASQKYTTDSVSAAVFKAVCDRAEVPYQVFTNRSDMAGGSTLGNLSNTHVSLNTVDIGLAQLAMHSPYETAGVKDTYYLVKAMEEFYNSYLEDLGNGCYSLKK